MVMNIWICVMSLVEADEAGRENLLIFGRAEG